MIALWPCAFLLITDDRPPRFWICRQVGERLHHLEWRHSEALARKRADELRKAGHL